jgi:hypothetical protein
MYVEVAGGNAGMGVEAQKKSPVLEILSRIERHVSAFLA